MILKRYKALFSIEKIEVMIAIHSVLSAELDAILKLREQKKISVQENKLAKNRQEILQKKLFECDREIFQIFYEEVPDHLENREEILEKIEEANILLWPYNSGIPNTKNDTDIDEYKALTYIEKIERKIAEYNILSVEMEAIIRRSKNKKINEQEKRVLKTRKRELKESICACTTEIWRVKWDEMPRNALDKEDVYKKIRIANIT